MGCTSNKAEELVNKPLARHSPKNPEKVLQVQERDHKKKHTVLEDIKIDVQKYQEKQKTDLLEKYKVIRLIRETQTGKTLKVELKGTKQTRGMKIVYKKFLPAYQEAIAELQAQVEIIKQVNHPNVLTLYEFAETQTSFQMVHQYISGSMNLFELISQYQERLDTALILKIVFQLLYALASIHRKDIIHGTLRPRNIIIDSVHGAALDLRLHISNMGISKLKSVSEMIHTCENVYYIAPEMLTSNVCTSACDIWAVGVIAFIMVIGKPPYIGASNKEIMISISHGADIAGELKECNDHLKDLILSMLTYQMEDRPTAEQLLRLPCLMSDFMLTFNDGATASTIHELVSFTKRDKFCQAISAYIASYIMNEEESDELSKIFIALDTAKTGVLSRQELIQAFSEKYGQKIATEEVDQILQALDLNKNGCIDILEFKAAATEREKLFTTQNLQKAFKDLDLDGTGTLSAIELQKAFGGGDTDTDVWEKWLRKYSRNPNFLTFYDFQRLLQIRSKKAKKSLAPIRK